MNIPKFSVVIPTHNRAREIFFAINSVLNQTFQDFELIIVDDGSTDDTKNVVDKIQDERIRYIYQSNNGGSRARNEGILSSKGEYIAFLDSDDVFLADKLECVYDISRIVNADVFYSYVTVDRGNGVTGIKPTRSLGKEEPVDEYLFCSCQTIQTTSLVVKSTMAKEVLFKDGLKKGQDLDFSIRLFKNGAFFYFIGKELAIWNDKVSANRVSHTNHAKELNDWLIENRSILTNSAYYGFRANILSYEIARDKPILALKDIVLGIIYGKTSIKRACHSAARAFIPRNLYRNCVDYYIKIINFNK